MNLTEITFEGVKKLEVSNGAFAEPKITATFEIDFNYPEVKERIVEMTTFWSGSPSRSDPFPEHLEWWLKYTTSRLHHIDTHGIFGSAKALDQHLWHQEEGFAYGCYVGIELVDFEAEQVDMEMFEVEQIGD